MRILRIRFRAQTQPLMIPPPHVYPPPEEINYATGADLALGLRTTVAFDVIWANHAKGRHDDVGASRLRR